jgi:hypothetical protein
VLPVEIDCMNIHERPLVAFWVGRAFANKITGYHLRTPAPCGPQVVTPEGTIRVLPAQDAYLQMQRWLAHAFARCIRTNESAIAELMAQVSPGDDLTRAALWHTSPEPGKSEYLIWFERLERDAGRTLRTTEMVSRFRQLCEDAMEIGNKQRLLDVQAEMLGRITLLSVSQVVAAAPKGSDLSGAFVIKHRAEWRYPDFQFDAEGRLYPEIPLVITALGTQASQWDVLHWFLEPNEHFTETPLAHWPKDRLAVLEAARRTHWFGND